MKGLVFDLDETGLATVFKPYQIEVMKLLYEKGTLISREAHSPLSHMISRASIINFLNYLVDEDLLLFTEKTGKGGYHRVYSPKHDTFADFLKAIFDRFEERLSTDLLGAIDGLSASKPDATEPGEESPGGSEA